MVARAEHDWDGPDSVSATVVACLAEYLDVDARELEPLEHAVDTDALDAVFATRANGMQRRRGELSFPFEGYRITVRADGEVLVRAPPRDG